MYPLRVRLMVPTERLLQASWIALLVGATLAFGGAVWWGRLFMGGLTAVIVLTWLARVAIEGRLRVIKSPVPILGAMVLLLGMFQLVSLPGSISSRLSPVANDAYRLGVIPRLVSADDPDAKLPEAAPVRTPLSLDRAATLRWVVGASACLAIFLVASHYTDRLQRTYVIWGAVVAAFFVVNLFALIQIGGQTRGFYGAYAPGLGPKWAPGLSDLTRQPVGTVIVPSQDAGAAIPSWPVTKLASPEPIAGFLDGPGGYMATASLGLPLAFAILLQILAPRGSRLSLAERLRAGNKGGLVVVLGGLTLTSGILVGLFGGLYLAWPFLVAVVLIGLPSAWPSGLRWAGMGMTALVLLAIGLGILLGDVWPMITPGWRSPRIDPAMLTAAWKDALRISRDFPLVGVGLGGFATIQPYYKSQAISSNTAFSSLLQLFAETGVVGLGILALGLLWCLFKLFRACRRVGSADFPAAFGLIGTAACFSLVSALHGTVEMASVALAASAVAGTAHRWLAGGTDLFLERD